MIFPKLLHIHYCGCGQNLSNFLPEKLNLGRLHINPRHYWLLEFFFFFQFYLLFNPLATCYTSYTNTCIAVPDCPVRDHHNFTFVGFLYLEQRV